MGDVKLLSSKGADDLTCFEIGVRPRVVLDLRHFQSRSNS